MTFIDLQDRSRILQAYTSANFCIVMQQLTSCWQDFNRQRVARSLCDKWLSLMSNYAHRHAILLQQLSLLWY